MVRSRETSDLAALPEAATLFGDGHLLLGEPPPTQADLNFSVLGIPVRVHPFFWLVGAILGLNGGSEPVTFFIWMGVLFVSILVHELGHALMFRAYGGQPWITLYGMGGLASCNHRPHGVAANVAISFAGPAAGFLLAGSVLAAIRFSGREIIVIPWIVPFAYAPFVNPNLNDLVWFLLYVNFAWGLVNLLPIYPLDGGKISRELLVGVHPRQGVVWSLGLSMAAAAAMAIYGLRLQSLFIVIFFGYLAFSSFTTLQAYQRWGGP
jgi:Zn-dependent protease